MAPAETNGNAQRGDEEIKYEKADEKKEEDESFRETLDSCSLIRKLNMTCKVNWKWNEFDASHAASIHGDDNKYGVTFHPHWSNGTAGIRANQPLMGALNYWEIHVTDRVFGTSLMFGVSTKKARLHVNEFKHMLGEDKNGWGLSHRGRTYHNGEASFYCKAFQEYKSVIVGVLVDRDRGEITFFKDGENLGVAFRGLEKVQEDLYPTICSTAAKTAMLVGQRCRSFISLQDRCRQSIANTLVERNYSGKSYLGLVDSLPLPFKMKCYILLGLDAIEPHLYL